MGRAGRKEERVSLEAGMVGGEGEKDDEKDQDQIKDLKGFKEGGKRILRGRKKVLEKDGEGLGEKR